MHALYDVGNVLQRLPGEIGVAKGSSSDGRPRVAKPFTHAMGKGEDVAVTGLAHDLGQRHVRQAGGHGGHPLTATQAPDVRRLARDVSMRALRPASTLG